MTWKTLASALESALASMMNEVGEGSGETLPDAVKLAKSADPEGPASWEEVVSGDTALPAQEDHTSKERRIAPASPKAGKGSPTPAVRRSLFVVVEGGRPAEGGGRRAADARTAGQGRTAASNMVLIEGGRRHWTASAF